MHIFIWSGSKLFSYITVYSPDQGDIKAIHFGDSFTSIVRSLEELHAMDQECTKEDSTCNCK